MEDLTAESRTGARVLVARTGEGLSGPSGRRQSLQDSHNFSAQIRRMVRD